jgi:hypothetical protein
MNFVAELNLWLKVCEITFYTGSGIEMTARSKIRVCSTHKLYVRSCTVKKVIVFVFPVRSRDVSNRTLPGREKLNYSRPEFG